MLYRLAGFASTLSRYVRALLLYPTDVGVVAIVEQEGRIVLVRHSYRPGWMFPGGGVGRNESPARAILRELEEEIGLTSSAPPQLLGAFVRPGVWVANLVLLFSVRQAVFAFKPNLEIREILLADPANIPDGVSPAVRRRLQELADVTPSPKW